MQFMWRGALTRPICIPDICRNFPYSFSTDHRSYHRGHLENLCTLLGIVAPTFLETAGKRVLLYHKQAFHLVIMGVRTIQTWVDGTYSQSMLDMKEVLTMICCCFVGGSTWKNIVYAARCTLTLWKCSMFLHPYKSGTKILVILLPLAYDPSHIF